MLAAGRAIPVCVAFGSVLIAAGRLLSRRVVGLTLDRRAGEVRADGACGGLRAWESIALVVTRINMDQARIKSSPANEGSTLMT